MVREHGGLRHISLSTRMCDDVQYRPDCQKPVIERRAEIYKNVVMNADSVAGATLKPM